MYDIRPTHALRRGELAGHDTGYLLAAVHHQTLLAEAAAWRRNRDARIRWRRTTEVTT